MKYRATTKALVVEYIMSYLVYHLENSAHTILKEVFFNNKIIVYVIEGFSKY